MIARLWRAWASPANGRLYADFLRRDFLPGLHGVPGYHGAELLQRQAGEEIELIVITRWASLEVIGAFAGEDVEAAHVAPHARALLSRFEDRCQHFETAFEDLASDPA